MDQLREATRFRGYAQRDPLSEYKKDGFALFESTMERIAVEAATRVLHIDPDFIKKQQEAMERQREMEARMREAMQFGFQQPGAPVLGANPTEGQANLQAAQHNARPQPLTGPLPGAVRRAPAPAPQAPTAVKEVGRNDPCPCGSGKKYKKCHGVDA
jgi:preprotein translocase subunit SecA